MIYESVLCLLVKMTSDETHFTFKLKESQSINDTLDELRTSLLKFPTLPKICEQTQTTKLTSEVFKKLEDELSEVELAYSVTCENVERLEAELEALRKEVDEKNSYNKKQFESKAALEREYELLSKSSVSSQDQELLENTKMRYKALRNITQVRFDYSKSNTNSLHGFAFNKKNNRVEYFSINNLSNLTQEQIFEKIFACMEKVSGNNYADITL